jgi:N-acetyl-gamma-glutamyl-phosphate reductase
MNVGIIGATGYVGIELFRILLRHPKVKKINVSSVSFEGRDIEDVYANLFTLSGEKTQGRLASAEQTVEASDIVFTALPHGAAEEHAAACLNSGKKLIDLSADFRFGNDQAVFLRYYKTEWKHPHIHSAAVYGLPEMYRAQIAKACVVGNPGCYVTSATLGLLPALKHGCVALEDPIIVDGKSGVTGAGRKADMMYQFTECGESISPYGVGTHRHEPEIERNFSLAAGSACAVVFTPHLIPINRGVFTTVYARLNGDFLREGDAAQRIRALYESFYKDEPFVRVLKEAKMPSTRNVRFSNYCDINVSVVKNNTTLIVTSCLDNMIKGAAGQAVQNMNIMQGFSETAGLDTVPPAF